MYFSSILNIIKEIYLANIEVYADENLEKALKRFKRKVEKEGIIREFKKRQYFQKPSAMRHEQEKTRKLKELKRVRKLEKRKMY
jgi:small subunit ribosomal protein S21